MAQKKVLLNPTDISLIDLPEVGEIPRRFSLTHKTTKLSCCKEDIEQALDELLEKLSLHYGWKVILTPPDRTSILERV